MSSGKSRRASPTTAASAATPAAASAPGIGAEQLDDVILMMHQIVLRESAASRGRVTPVGRETARAILRIQGAAKTGRGIPTDAAASTALRYLFRDVAAKLAAVWRKIVADATPEKSVLWERRAQFAELEEIYAELGISDFSDPLELKLKDIGAVYDSFRRNTTSEEHVAILMSEVSEAIEDRARSSRQDPGGDRAVPGGAEGAHCARDARLRVQGGARRLRPAGGRDCRGRR